MIKEYKSSNYLYTAALQFLAFRRHLKEGLEREGTIQSAILYLFRASLHGSCPCFWSRVWLLTLCIIFTLIWSWVAENSNVNHKNFSIQFQHFLKMYSERSISLLLLWQIWPWKTVTYKTFHFLLHLSHPSVPSSQTVFISQRNNWIRTTGLWTMRNTAWYIFPSTHSPGFM